MPDGQTISRSRDAPPPRIVVADDSPEMCGLVTLMLRTRGFDVVVARGFASPGVTAECAAPLLRDGGLRVSIRDDGRGGADFAGGTGLAGLKDRMEALGGRIWLHSPPGAGTHVQIVMPLRPR